jgi:hypothetical protein
VLQEAVMARIVIRCQYTGHYVFTGIETRPDSVIGGGRIFCPYCATDHIWTCNEARIEQNNSSLKKPLVRQAS